MIGILTSFLAKEGLDLLKGIVSKGGKKAVEKLGDKIGIDLTTETGIEQLKNNPEALLKLKQIENESNKMFLEDVKNSRNREIEITKVTGKRDIFLYILASIIIVGFFSVLTLLVLRKEPINNQQILSLIIGALLSSFGAVVQYFFGSSKSSSDKTNLLGGK